MQNMLVTFQVDPSLIYGGSTEPAALVELRYAAGGNIPFSTSVVPATHLMGCKRLDSVAVTDFGSDIHARLTKIISDILSEKLRVPNKRCHIVVSCASAYTRTAQAAAELPMWTPC